MAEIAEQSRRALPKNFIRPLPVQDPKGERFRRPALPFAGARRRSGWRRLQWRRSSEERQNPNSIRSSYEFPNLRDSTYNDLWCTFFMREVVRI